LAETEVEKMQDFLTTFYDVHDFIADIIAAKTIPLIISVKDVASYPNNYHYVDENEFWITRTFLLSTEYVNFETAMAGFCGDSFADSLSAANTAKNTVPLALQPLDIKRLTNSTMQQFYASKENRVRS
jgi:hypothetical protein